MEETIFKIQGITQQSANPLPLISTTNSMPWATSLISKYYHGNSIVSLSIKTSLCAYTNFNKDTGVDYEQTFKRTVHKAIQAAEYQHSYTGL